MSVGAITMDNNYYEDNIYDEKVSDCLLMLYFSIMSNEKQDSDKFYNSFQEKYNELDDEQQEIAKIEIAKILDIDYKPKQKEKKKER